MKVFKAKIVGGKIEVPPGTADDETEVTVLISEGESTFTPSPEEVRELQASIDEASRGELVDGWQLLDELAS